MVSSFVLCAILCSNSQSQVTPRNKVELTASLEEQKLLKLKGLQMISFLSGDLTTSQDSFTKLNRAIEIPLTKFNVPYINEYSYAMKSSVDELNSIREKEGTGRLRIMIQGILPGDIDGKRTDKNPSISNFRKATLELNVYAKLTYNSEYLFSVPIYDDWVTYDSETDTDYSAVTKLIERFAFDYVKANK